MPQLASYLHLPVQSGSDKVLKANYHDWARGNRLSSHALINTGHSYGNIIQRNANEFAKHPEDYALLENGERDSKRPPTARKFCFSNPGLQELAVRDLSRAPADVPLIIGNGHGAPAGTNSESARKTPT